jgi:hypothetical protein
MNTAIGATAAGGFGSATNTAAVAATSASSS